jgi:hypothetical protein
VSLVIALLGLNLALIPAVFTAWNLWLYRPPPARRSGRVPAVSVLIPARNEAQTIAQSLEAVLASRDVELEVVVMDDHSTDGTADIVMRLARHDGRLRLLRAPVLPVSWCGKQHACWRLAQAARQPLLLFQDADVRLAPDAIARMVAYLEKQQIDLLSGFPRQQVVTLTERLVIPLIHFLLLGYLPMIGMRYSCHPAFGVGCGQVFLTRRRAYEIADGHRAIAASRHDGIALPRAYRRAGQSTDLVDLTDLARCRMYRSASELWQGFAKNADEGMATRAAIVPWTILLIGGQVAPILASSWLLITGSLYGPAATITLAAAVLAYATRFTVAWRFRQSLLGAALHPLGVMMVVAIQWYARVRVLIGIPVAWKGRAPA